MLRVGCIQMCSGLNVAKNIDKAVCLIKQAHDMGAEYILTPEMTNILVRGGCEPLKQALAQMPHMQVLEIFQALAQDLSITLHLGSLGLWDGKQFYNRAYIINKNGDIIDFYDKIHLFDVDLGGSNRWEESAIFKGGTRAVCVPVHEEWRSGVSICYDLRFAKLYRFLAVNKGAHILTIPAAFTKVTGEAHWHSLLRARAIENSCFVMASAQGGQHEDGRQTYGHSLIIDPWGRILAEKEDDQEGVIIADLDMEIIMTTRQNLPSLKHGRDFH